MGLRKIITVKGFRTSFESLHAYELYVLQSC